MNAELFIKNYGFKRASEVLLNVVEGQTHHREERNEPSHYKYDQGWWYFSKGQNWATSSINFGKHGIKESLISIDELKSLLTSHEILEGLGGLRNALDHRYMEDREYCDNSAGIDKAIEDYKKWFKPGDVIVLKHSEQTAEDRPLRKITRLVRDDTVCECDDGWAYSVSLVRNATLAEKKLGNREDEAA
ncbi:hypothetical protein KSB07_03400 [Acinetobacter junii]|uniref:hypothetical protein n=1 Tax=Acinetobacter TaxID=469 RepID=UPI001F432B20|nr:MULTISPECIES: hypothetical protein [Acinetobacter]MCE6003403.1 hypothetical protein [Acinetobacter junii]